VVDVEPMTVLDRIDDLDEHRADELVVAEVALALGDHAEQVAVGAEGKHDVDARRRLDHVVQRDDVGMRRGERMQGDLAALERALTTIEADLVEALDGEPRRRPADRSSPRRIHQLGLVHDAVRAETDDRDEFEPTVVNPMADEVLRVVGMRDRRRRGHGDKVSWAGDVTEMARLARSRRRGSSRSSVQAASKRMWGRGEHGQTVESSRPAV